MGYREITTENGLRRIAGGNAWAQCPRCEKWHVWEGAWTLARLRALCCGRSRKRGSGR